MAQSVVMALAQVGRRSSLGQLWQSDVLLRLTVHKSLGCSKCGGFSDLLRPGWCETGRSVVDRLGAYGKNAASMEPHVIEFCVRADGFPGVIKLSKVRPRLPLGNHPGVAGKARET